MITGFGILGFRDENSIRPLCLRPWSSVTISGTIDYFTASESISPSRHLTNAARLSKYRRHPAGPGCVYRKGRRAAFPSSCLAKIICPFQRSRQNMSLELAKRMWDVEKISSPSCPSLLTCTSYSHSRAQTSTPTAVVLASSLNRLFSNDFAKTRYVYRTFILPGQRARQQSVRRKLSPIEAKFGGKIVCLVDDSIVWGTTSREIVCLLGKAWAKITDWKGKK